VDTVDGAKSSYPQLKTVDIGGKHPLILDGFQHVSTILLVAQDFATIHSRARLDVERILIAYIIHPDLIWWYHLMKCTEEMLLNDLCLDVTINLLNHGINS